MVFLLVFCCYKCEICSSTKWNSNIWVVFGAFFVRTVDNESSWGWSGPWGSREGRNWTAVRHCQQWELQTEITQLCPWLPVTSTDWWIRESRPQFPELSVRNGCDFGLELHPQWIDWRRNSTFVILFVLVVFHNSPFSVPQKWAEEIRFFFI